MVVKKNSSKRNTRSTLAIAKKGGVSTVPLSKLFHCADLMDKRSIFKVLHVKEGRKNATKVFSAVVADDTAVIRLVTFGLISCQKAKSVLQEDSIVAARWNKATYDPQQPHYRTYELEKWQIKLDDSTILQALKLNSFKKTIPPFEKAKKTKKETVLLESFEEISDLKNNDRISFKAQLVGGVGMKRPQRNGTFFKILVSNSKSESMPVVYVFNHDEIYEILQKTFQASCNSSNFVFRIITESKE